MTAYPGGDTAVNGMLQGAWRGGVRSFWMVGTGDLRPSLMELNLTGALWCTPDTDCAAPRTAYLRCTYRAPDGWALTDSALEDLSVCLRARAEDASAGGQPAAAGGRSVPDPQHPAVCFRPGCAAKRRASPKPRPTVNSSWSN